MDGPQSVGAETELLRAVQSSVFGGDSARQGAIRDQLFNYQMECYQSLYTLVERSLRWEESNSVLLLGPTGSGKTFLVDCVLARLSSEYRLGTDVCVVKLNGLIHNSGPAAVEQIIIDLKIEEAKSKATSFESSLTLLLEYLYESKRKKTPIVFVLDNFDLLTKHKNQNLLYSLFDIAQSNSCPISVVGITARLDVIELLEKRVKSRFSHRQLYLATDYTFPEYSRMVSQLLNPASIKNKEWSEHVDAILCHPLVQSSIKQLFSCSKNVCVLQNFLATPLSRLRRRGFRFDPQDFQESWHCINVDPSVEMLSNLSLLEKCIMVSASKLHDQNPKAKLSFDAIFREYEHFARSSSSIDLLSRDKALRAVGHLMQLELLSPTEGTKRSRDTSCVSLLVSREQVRKGILDPCLCPTDIIQWAGRVSSY